MRKRRSWPGASFYEPTEEPRGYFLTESLRIARPRPEVRETMHAAGVHRVLRIYDTVEEVCAGGS